jgi:transcriptional regulator with XRE-family HTH domain
VPAQRLLQGRLARNLRREREGRQLTQEELAWKARLNTRHLQKLEEGSVNATLRTVERLGKALGVDPALLLR